jgi:sugar lactone lactonase YvrE
VNEYSTIVTGIGMGESARWHDGQFWFADWIAGTISVRQPDDTVRVVTSVPSFPISFDWLPDGRMLVVSGRQGQLLVLNDGNLEPYADLSGLSPYPWNELAIDAQGNVFVNGIGYAFPGPPEVAGLIARVTPDGAATLVASDLAFPNGMVLTADGRTLIVGESHAGCLTAFDIAPDGTLANRRTWATVQDSAPDGICWGVDGAIWYADVPNRQCVLVAEGGKIVDVASFDAACFACAASDDTLYAMTADWPLNFAPTASRSGEVRVNPLHNS